MKKQFIITFLILISLPALSQDFQGRKPDSLIQLRRQNRVLPKYVNFDVLKFTFSHGYTGNKNVQHGMGLSFRMQILYPYPLFKKTILPIAYGITFGYNKATIKNQKFIFSGNRLQTITPATGIRNTMQRTGYVGFVVLTAQRVSRWWTILAGASAEYNLFSKLKERNSGSPKINAYFNKASINRFSLPLHLQLSFSPTQFWSFGAHYTHDIRPIYKGPNFKNMNQRQLGISLAVII
jgi:hypothetical protein